MWKKGCEQLERSRALAEKIRSDSWVASAFVNLGSACGEVYRFDLADNYLRQGIEFCSDRDIDFSQLYQLSWQALVWMYRGRYTEASGTAHVVLADRPFASDCSNHRADRTRVACERVVAIRQCGKRCMKRKTLPGNTKEHCSEWR